MIKNALFRCAMGMAVAVVLGSVTEVSAAIPTFSNSAGLAYGTQTFDTLGTATANWTDDSTIGGWFLTDNNAWDNAGPNSLAASTGGTAPGNGGNFFNFGTSSGGSTGDRSLGSIPRDSTRSGLRPQYIGLALAYTGSVALTQLQVIYTGEWWRDGFNGTDGLTFDFRVTTTVPTAGLATWDNTQTWNAVSGLNYSVTGNGSDVAGMDGSSQKNTAFSASVPAGNVTTQYIMLRWTHTDVASQNEHGLAIDDVIVAVPEAGTWAAGAIMGTAVILGYRRSRHSVA